MRIDDRAEPLARAAIDAAVKRDFEKLEAALQNFTSDDVTQRAVELALAVASFVLYDVHEGKPTPAQTRVVAVKIAEMETWAEPTAEEVEDFLSRLLGGHPFAAVMPPESVIVLSFVVTANLLSSFRKSDEKWWDYLDRAEAAIEGHAGGM